jgi:ribosomal protein S18 acetylase RimI-like enzyme
VSDAAVTEVHAVDDALVAQIAALVGQLSATAAPPSRAELEAIVGSDATRLLVGRDGDAVLGMLTLALFRIPSGLQARIEDVVVDDAARGRGIARALTAAALDLAREAGARKVDLTSHPSRAAANRLYQRLGFALRETNVYRFEL